MTVKGQNTVMYPQKNQSTVDAYSRSLRQFCNFVEHCSQEVEDAETIAEMCEAHAESVRLTAQDVTMESIDLLLNTMLNTLYNMSEAQEQKRWSHRLKNAIFARGKTEQYPQQTVAFQQL